MAPTKGWLAARIRLYEKRLLVRVLKKTNGNITLAAKIAERNRTDFYRMLNRHGIKPGDYKPKPAEAA